ncbi:MAG: hypothetical protein PF483_07935 [Halothiobacillus sp.]|jgi:hypothetical protein|nr:hypothetical protein [Halothiobacillus sp.]
MTEHFYRYRPVKAVLDEFRELENREIYLSTADELNDPMEGLGSPPFSRTVVKRAE